MASRSKRSPECRASERTLLEFCGGQRRNSIPDQLRFSATADATPVRWLPNRSALNCGPSQGHDSRQGRFRAMRW